MYNFCPSYVVSGNTIIYNTHIYCFISTIINAKYKIKIINNSYTKLPIIGNGRDMQNFKNFKTSY